MNERITVYDASNSDRIALSAWRTMFLEIVDFRELIFRLVKRGFAGQFRQSFLGYLWVALPPIATTLVFVVLRQANIVNVPMEGHLLPYALYVLVGTTIWGFFTQVTMMSTTSISGAGTLVSKIYFPREVLVLSAIGNAFVNLLIRLCVVAMTFAAFMFIPHWQAIFVPVLLLPMCAFALGLGLIFAPVNTMMHDVGRMLEFAFQFGVFLVPAVYPTPALMGASTWEAGLYWIHTLNPVSHFIDASHSLIEYGTIQWDAGLIVATGISFLTLAIGWRFFHVCEPLFAERL